MPKGRSCRPCDLVWGTVGILGGMVLLYIGLDLLTNGTLTALLTGAGHAEPAELEGEPSDDE